MRGLKLLKISRWPTMSPMKMRRMRRMSMGMIWVRISVWMNRVVMVVRMWMVRMWMIRMRSRVGKIMGMVVLVGVMTRNRIMRGRRRMKSGLRV